MEVRAIDLVNFANQITAAMVEMQRVNVDTKLALDRLNETLKDMMGIQEAILQEMKKNE
jgi:hypothetical protein